MRPGPDPSPAHRATPTQACSKRSPGGPATPRAHSVLSQEREPAEGNALGGLQLADLFHLHLVLPHLLLDQHLYAPVAEARGEGDSETGPGMAGLGTGYPGRRWLEMAPRPRQSPMQRPGRARGMAVADWLGDLG